MSGRLYAYQERVAEALLGGHSVVLQAPTGTGKTLAALVPFLNAREHARDFPRKCIYSVPLRVLATQFWNEWRELAGKLVLDPPIDVTIQTGAQPDDPRLEGDLIFTTIDQALSSALNIPYALSHAQANLNAGAVLSSYLVFDELHLFPREMLATTLHLLQMLRGIVPCLVMTATLSEEIVAAVAGTIGAVPIVLSPEEAGAIPSQHKTRRIRTVAQEITAEAVLRRHRERSVVVCNTVGRAQTLFENLRAQAGHDVEVRLLHSRFLPRDRDATEHWLCREFGKRRTDRAAASAILVATQVVEVGLDITSEALHTELAPAASIIQRAGRCARYENEEGDVYVYALPDDRDGRPSYAPYLEEQQEICDKTCDALARRTGEVFDFGAELRVVNAAHADADRRLIDELRAQRYAVADKIAHTIEHQERGEGAELIRDIDSRTVIVHPDPPSMANPWSYEGFGLYRGTLLGAYGGLIELQQALGETWALMTADPEEEETSHEPVMWRWRTIGSRDELARTLWVVANPRLVAYSAETGFQLGVSGDGAWRSPSRERRGRRRIFAPYEHESFEEHVTRMQRVYDYAFYDHEADRQRLPLRDEIAFSARRLEIRYGWEPGTLDDLARLIIALHDVGKLDIRWQAWAHHWQEECSRLRETDLRISEDYLAAHTDYDEQDPGEKELSHKLHHLRPNHAVESAAASMELLRRTCGNVALAKAALTAIARHHSAGASGRYGDFQAHAAAAVALRGMLPPGDGIEALFPAGNLSKRLIRPGREEELLPYLLLVRVLRLADQRSQER